MPQSRIVVVEQGNDKPFNRGKILNVGFAHCKNSTRNFITHDVDINPREKAIRRYYRPSVKRDRVRAILTSPWDTLGGIVKMQTRTVHKINGFPNEFWGWGVEDKALKNRAEFYGIATDICLIHDDKTRDDELFKTFDDVEDREKIDFVQKTNREYGMWKQLSDDEKMERIKESGLNNLVYRLLGNVK